MFKINWKMYKGDFSFCQIHQSASTKNERPCGLVKNE